jgi:hypothetical protein
MLVKKIGQEAFEIKCDRKELIKIHQCINLYLVMNDMSLVGDLDTEQERKLQNYYDQVSSIYTSIDVELNQDN